MNESERERILDQRVQRRLATDREYRHAEDAEHQAEREAAIEREEVERLDRLAGEQESELAAESAWLRAAEYDPEAEAFDQHERSLGIEPLEDVMARENSPEAWAALRATGWGSESEQGETAADQQAGATSWPETVRTVAHWYDSPSSSNRRRALGLDTDGDLFAAVRDEPSDQWPGFDRIGRGYSLAEARRVAIALGLRSEVVEAAETRADELARLRELLAQLEADTPEHREALARVAVLVRERAEYRRRFGRRL